MKENRLLGNFSIKEAKEVITGSYIKDTKEKKIDERMLSILRKNWQINAFCFLYAEGIGIGIIYHNISFQFIIIFICLSVIRILSIYWSSMAAKYL